MLASTTGIACKMACWLLTIARLQSLNKEEVMVMTVEEEEEEVAMLESRRRTKSGICDSYSRIYDFCFYLN